MRDLLAENFGQCLCDLAPISARCFSYGIRSGEWAYVIIREELRAENDVFSVVRLWIREEVECYGGDVGGRDDGKFAFAGGGVDLAFAADVGEVLAFGEIFWRKSVS